MPAEVMSPAACHVVPAESSLRSSRTTSRTPSFVRWYATLVPIAPPPTTTTCARCGKVSVPSFVKVEPPRSSTYGRRHARRAARRGGGGSNNPSLPPPPAGAPPPPPPPPLTPPPPA